MFCFYFKLYIDPVKRKTFRLISVGITKIMKEGLCRVEEKKGVFCK